MYYDEQNMERRCLTAAEFRVDPDDPRITGYAAVFNTWTDIGGWFRESIRPGAFAKTIKEADVRALWNHDANYVLARNKSGSLKLREDDKGLAVEIDPVPAQWANDLLTSMRRGDVSQMSFGFQVNKQEVDYDKDERILVDVTLFDVSVVTYPAYPTTTAQVRSLFRRSSPLPPDTAQPPDPWAALDAIVAKLKAGEELTDEELRQIIIHVPRLSPPAASHAETPAPPAASHAVDDTRRTDKWTEFEIKHGIFAN